MTEANVIQLANGLVKLRDRVNRLEAQMKVLLALIGLQTAGIFTLIGVLIAKG